MKRILEIVGLGLISAGVCGVSAALGLIAPENYFICSGIMMAMLSGLTN